ASAFLSHARPGWRTRHHTDHPAWLSVLGRTQAPGDLAAEIIARMPPSASGEVAHMHGRQSEAPVIDGRLLRLQ
ncbi:hypothetical protein OFC55_39490, partial [Escherichia coli]|nr:hypothetical protein [Escherichia coli]